MIWDTDGIISAAIRTENNIEIIGIESLGIPLFGEQSLSVSYNLRSTPLNFGDSTTDEFTIPITIGADIIPGLDSLELPLPGATLDSLRILVTTKTDRNVTAWGTLDLQGTTHEVLKVEERDSTTFEIEIGLGLFGTTVFLNLADILGEMGGDIPGGGGGLDDFGIGDTGGLTYRFLSNDTKYSLVEFNLNEVLDTNGIVTDVFITGQLGESTGMVSTEEIAQPENLSIFPNPTATHFWLDTSSPLKTASHIKIYNTNGQCVTSLQNQPLHEPIDVSHLDQGQYILIGILDNERFSKKISVIK